MMKRYELTDDEWNRIQDLLPPLKRRGNREGQQKTAGRS